MTENSTPAYMEAVLQAEIKRPSEFGSTETPQLIASSLANTQIKYELVRAFEARNTRKRKIKTSEVVRLDQILRALEAYEAYENEGSK